MLEPWSLSARARRKALALKTYQGPVLAEAAAIHATSEMEAQNLRRLPWVRSPVYVVPNAVEIPAEVDEAVEPNAGPIRTLLFLSRIHPKKGLDMLLQAWNRLRPGNWRLLIVGNGEPAYVEYLKRYCASQGVPHVEFRSHVNGDEREAMFAGASAMVLPTYSENFGNVVAEALIRGLPVITTTGTPWSVIAEKRLGWFIDPQIDQLEAALREMVATDADELSQMGARGRDYATAHLTTDVVRERLLSMYVNVMRPG
jgi:glycosyltransferase involved in cell wall biosynthesis